MALINKIKKLFYQFIKNIDRKINQEIIHREYLNPPFQNFNERPVEYRFVFEQIAEFYPKTILDVGTGVTALPHLMANCGCRVTAIDNIKDYWPNGMHNRHYYVLDDDITCSKIIEQFDMITCVSTLEHIKKFDEAVKSMFRLLVTGGHLILTFPYNDEKYCENVYQQTGSTAPKNLDYITQAFSGKELDEWAKENQATITKQEFWQFFDGDYWTIGKKLFPPKKVERSAKHQLSCIVFKKN